MTLRVMPDARTKNPTGKGAEAEIGEFSTNGPVEGFKTVKVSLFYPLS